MRLSTLKKEEIRSVMKFLYGNWTPLEHESDSELGISCSETREGTCSFQTSTTRHKITMANSQARIEGSEFEHTK